MTLSLNHRTLGGVISDFTFGHHPMPWMGFTLVSRAATWDIHGRRAKVLVKEIVIIQGKENVKLYRTLPYGTEVLVTGQGLPYHCVANDSKYRGNVTLASVIQPTGDPWTSSVPTAGKSSTSKA
jgi:hypothetical protein